MRVLVTGSSGHLGEALVRTLREHDAQVHGLDLSESPYTDHVGSVADSEFVLRCSRGIDCVLHTATLHKPHLATHRSRDFVETNIQGTLNVLEAAVAGGRSPQQTPPSEGVPAYAGRHRGQETKQSRSSRFK